MPGFAAAWTVLTLAVAACHSAINVLIKQMLCFSTCVLLLYFLVGLTKNKIMCVCVCAQVYDRVYIALFSWTDSLRSHVILKIIVLNVHRNHKAYQGRGEGGRGRLCTYRYTATTRMIPALRWAAILKFINCDGQTLSLRHQTISTDQNF